VSGASYGGCSVGQYQNNTSGCGAVLKTSRCAIISAEDPQGSQLEYAWLDAQGIGVAPQGLEGGLGQPGAGSCSPGRLNGLSWDAAMLHGTYAKLAPC
jgi:hypothetical protein